jgi:hypothetical protein
MPRQLIQEALQQAQECAPAVQAAALVHAARVLAVFDKDAALSTVERGLALADGLPEKYRIILMPEAIATAAAVSPDLALAAYAHESADAETLSERMAFTMLHHGHVAALARYLSSPHVANAYPFPVVGEAIYSCKEDLESQQAILRAAITAARQNLPNAAPHHFWEAFDRWWTILPEQEAKSFLLEFVDLVLQQPDNRGSYTMGHAEVTCEYDDRARIVRISREFKRKPKVPDPFSVMSSSSTWIGTCVTPEGSYVVNPVKVEIRYDDADHPVEISYTAEGGMSARFTRTWNAAGRVETESQVIPKTRLRPGQLCSFTYDTRGRCVEFKTSMEGTEDYRTRFLYDDHDNMIEAGGSGGHERYEYDYDAQGNWVQRVTWTCPASQSDYRPTKVERRTIGYAEPHVESL